MFKNIKQIIAGIVTASLLIALPSVSQEISDTKVVNTTLQTEDTNSDDKKDQNINDEKQDIYSLFSRDRSLTEE